MIDVGSESKLTINRLTINSKGLTDTVRVGSSRGCAKTVEILLVSNGVRAETLDQSAISDIGSDDSDTVTGNIITTVTPIMDAV